MSQNFFKSPKARVLAVAPKAKCVKDWSRSGKYTVQLGDQFTDFNGRQISEIKTGTCNPADAWCEVVFELRLD